MTTLANTKVIKKLGTVSQVKLELMNCNHDNQRTRSTLRLRVQDLPQEKQ